MDIFDLDINEFERKVDELLENISQNDLLENLIKNGLEIEHVEYDIGYNINLKFKNNNYYQYDTDELEREVSLWNQEEMLVA